MATTTATGWLITNSGGWNVCIRESETDGEGVCVCRLVCEREMVGVCMILMFIIILFIYKTEIKSN